MLADGVVAAEEIERFLGLAERLPDLDVDEVRALNVVAAAPLPTSPKGLF
jgi:2-methylcitrate dehydratase